MAATHILAVGKFSKGHASLRVAPHTPQAAAELEAYLEQSVGQWTLVDCVLAEACEPDFSIEDDYDTYRYPGAIWS